MHKKRPVNLNIATIRLPITAISSILHRLSGIALCGFVFFLIKALAASLQSAESFDTLKASLSQPWLKFWLWLFLISLFFHFIAGIRHLLMDIGLAEGKKSGCYSAYSVIGLAVIFSIILGISLW